MALKFLNKKGWHTGSLRNVENVWKAEQKHEAEQKKLEELRKQIHEERERAEFRQLQEQAGLVPRQERLDFLYESGLAVGKGSSGFKELESLPKNDAGATASSSATAKPDAPGALFEDKLHSANDAWRKLHTDPLLMIRQREQEALARIKNNPVQMAMIRKSVEVSKGKDKEEEKSKKKKHKKSSKRRRHSSSEDDSEEPKRQNMSRDHDKELSARGHRHKESKDHRYNSHSIHKYDKIDSHPSKESSERGHRHKEYTDHRHNSPSIHKHDKRDGQPLKGKRSYYDSHREDRSSKHRDEPDRDKQNHSTNSSHNPRDESNDRRHRKPVKLSEEERAARLREMEMDAELHEEQRWKLLKKAEAHEAEEAIRDRSSLGRNFLDATQRSVYGTEKGGSSTIEESVRRRSHYLQGRSAAETNAFRR